MKSNSSFFLLVVLPLPLFLSYLGLHESHLKKELNLVAPVKIYALNKQLLLKPNHGYLILKVNPEIGDVNLKD
ncbi:hypothetical protein [Nostoc sp. 'Peltigera malacea cyanobiont' DB3992]|uniref:hypothetical protein n=1 Tax=Nostoc sp. 'Peltigera malacea cyanobiont' DB3992 TaxID=1206980 RepID=UPI000C03EB1F|nr:hypothetical protein [Nostoc sp. 'Peltigera malacea cyanobiont' DB3992]PHM06585.1 hypothetical protein CK516_32620 [Nostoc sp. 'Peltigera malacea cyanobiont' DB3992]